MGSCSVAGRRLRCESWRVKSALLPCQRLFYLSSTYHLQHKPNSPEVKVISYNLPTTDTERNAILPEYNALLQQQRQKRQQRSFQQYGFLFLKSNIERRIEDVADHASDEVRDLAFTREDADYEGGRGREGFRWARGYDLVRSQI
jgi:hypothetical protein